MNTTPDKVYDLAAAGRTIFAGCLSGVFRSDDGGSTWSGCFGPESGLQGITATALAASDTTLLAGVEGAVLRSDDGGATWQASTLSAPPPVIVDIVTGTTHIFAASADDGVFVSADNGATWTAWNFGLIDLKINCLAISPGHTVFAGTESGLFSSHNQGKSWREVALPQNIAPVLSLGVAADHLLVGTASHGIWLIDPNTQTWSPLPGWAELQAESVHTILPCTGNVALLTDHHLIELDPLNGTHRVLHTFPAQQALMLTRTTNLFVIGFADGSITTLTLP